MNARQFVFHPAKIIETDIGKRKLESVDSNSAFVSDESVFLLLENLLLDTPLSKVYKELKNVYKKEILIFSSDFEYVVEMILGRSVHKDSVYYWVKWEGWPPTFNSWEPEKNLVGCENIISDFLKQNICGFSRSKYEYKAPKHQQITDVMDRLKESIPLSDINPAKLFNMFVEKLSPQTDTIRQYRKFKINVSRYKQGERPRAIKRPRLTAQSEAALKESIEAFQKMINIVYSSEARILVENKVDMECPPNDFQPICDYIPDGDVYLPTKAVIGCDCQNLPEPEIDVENSSKYPASIEPCWINRNNGCCAVRAGGRIPYSFNKRLLLPPGNAVFECNSSCACGPSCPFRVVQLGRKMPVSIFRTSNGRGWGVKAIEKIPKGTFVTEYLGEIITCDGAEKRGQLYDKQRMTYLFDLDFDGEAHYTVDAVKMGNISHFINHSCDPNLTVRCVFIECLNTKLPRLALFSERYIRKNEELTFDYQMAGARDDDDAELTNVSIRTEMLQPEVNEAVKENDTAQLVTHLVPPLPPPTSNNTAYALSETGSSCPPDSFSEISSVNKSPDVTSKKIKMKCLCGSKKCRGYLVC